MKILITGITGFLGSGLADELGLRHEIIGISGNTGTKADISGVKIYGNNELAAVAKENPEVIIMCHAAVSSGNFVIDSLSLYEANVQFTEKIIELFPNQYHLYISSVSVYGIRNEVINESSLPNPGTSYSISKLWGEEVVGRVENYGILRLSSIYGKGMKENTILPVYVRQALEYQSINVWGSGERRQNYLYLKDAIQFIEKMIMEKSRGIFLGVSENETSNLELAEMIASVTGSMIKFSGNDKELSVKFDNTYTRKRLNIPADTKLQEGIEIFVTWKKGQF